MSARLPCACAVLFVSLSLLPAADAPPAPPAASAIDDAVRRLGDRRFNVREQAVRQLWEAGAAAEPALRQALQSGDPEVARRARDLLTKFEWGIYPDTPPAVLTQIEHYRDGDDEAKRQAVEALARLGKPGYAALAKFSGRASTPEARRLLGDALTAAVQKVVPQLLLDRDYAAAESLAEASLVGGGEDAAGHYAALMLLRNKLDDAVRRWEAEAKAAPPPSVATVLVALYRAKGDAAAARRAAAGRDELLDSLLWEQGDWKELARRPLRKLLVGDQPPRPAQALALQAGYHRLAGDGEACAADLDKLRKLTDPDEDATVTKALLLNERPAAALERLTRQPDGRAAVFDLLVAQSRYREALELAEKPGGDPESRPLLLLNQARTLYHVGEKDRAVRLFAKLAGDLRAPAEGEWLVRLVETEHRLGLRDAACEHAGHYLGLMARLAPEERRSLSRQVLDAVFPKRGEAAEVWWTFLRQQSPREEEPAVMKRLRALLDPPADGAAPAGPGDLAAALLAAQSDDRPRERTRARLALAVAHEAAGQLDAAREQLAAAAAGADGPEAWLKLGDFQARRRQYAPAARAYAEAWARDKTQSLPLYLQGWALARAGQAAEGQALQDQAHALPLGDVAARAELAAELAKRDLPDLARREWAVIPRLGWARHWYAGNLLILLARDAAERHDYARAAADYDRIATGLLGSEMQFTDASFNLLFAGLARTHKARAALAAGRVEEALAHARVGLELIPGNIDLAILLVPELARRGRPADADALYARAAAVHEGLCRDYPRSGLFHNNAAWLAACCRRDLDAARDHATQATELEPHSASYRDTLAEVNFQRGDTAKAVELMQACLRQEPHRAYFAKQLRRFEAGDPTVPPPADGEGD